MELVNKSYSSPRKFKQTLFFLHSSIDIYRKLTCASNKHFSFSTAILSLPTTSEPPLLFSQYSISSITGPKQRIPASKNGFFRQPITAIVDPELPLHFADDLRESREFGVQRVGAAVDQAGVHDSVARGGPDRDVLAGVLRSLRRRRTVVLWSHSRRRHSHRCRQMQHAGLTQLSSFDFFSFYLIFSEK